MPTRSVPQMKIESELLKPPREKAGAAADRAFEFQKHHAMSRMLKAHQQGLSYSAYFDHHDDLVFVEHSPTEKVSFYQVKTRGEGPWTPKRLSTRAGKGENPKSIVGKAYYNIALFGSNIARAAIVSNQMLKATHADDEPTSLDDGEIVLGNLCEGDWGVFSGAIAADFTGLIDPAGKTLLTFERVALDPYSFSTTLKGEVAEFADHLGGGAARAAIPIYESLLSEISRCTGDTMKAKTLTELKGRKAITRGQVEALVLRVAARSASPMEWWDQLSHDFDMAGLTGIQRQRLRNQCIAYWQARKGGMRAAIDYGAAVRTAIVNYPLLAEGHIMTCVAAFGLLGLPPGPIEEPYKEDAVILVELMEHHNDA